MAFLRKNPIWPSLEALKLNLTEMSPGYFAFPMATGIVAISAHDHGLKWVALGLLWLNVATYVVLWGLSLARLLRWPGRFLADLTDHSRGSEFLTMAAASCVLGSQFADVGLARPIAIGLWALGLVLCVGLAYAFFVVMTVREPKPTLEAGINGGWLLVIVAIESVALLGVMVAPDLPASRGMTFLAISAHFAGGMLYILFITLILYRWLFFRMRPEKLSPVYWVDMGAVSITALAGAYLYGAAGRGTLLEGLAPFLLGFTLLFWATATWWIPLLLMVEVWRHLRRRVVFRYSPDYWSLVFPLGTYSAATFVLGRILGLPLLRGVSSAFLGLAATAWAIVFGGLIWQGVGLKDLRSTSET